MCHVGVDNQTPAYLSKLVTNSFIIYLLCLATWAFFLIKPLNLRPFIAKQWKLVQWGYCFWNHLVGNQKSQYIFPRKLLHSWSMLGIWFNRSILLILNFTYFDLKNNRKFKIIITSSWRFAFISWEMNKDFEAQQIFIQISLILHSRQTLWDSRVQLF